MNYIITETDLIDMANAIRNKTEKSETISFPSEYVEEINSLGIKGNSGLDAFINNSLSGTYTNSKVKSIYTHVFAHFNELTSVSFPTCTNIGSSAFCYCSALTTANFPACINIGYSAFDHCSALTTVSFPACTSINAHAFYYCSALTTASFPACTYIGSSAFYKCYKLISLYLTGSSYVALSTSKAFNSSPIGGYSSKAGQYGSIYVPTAMLATYKTRTNWTYFSSRMKGV